MSIAATYKLIIEKHLKNEDDFEKVENDLNLKLSMVFDEKGNLRTKFSELRIALEDGRVEDYINSYCTTFDHFVNDTIYRTMKMSQEFVFKAFQGSFTYIAAKKASAIKRPEIEGDYINDLKSVDLSPGSDLLGANKQTGRD